MSTHFSLHKYVLARQNRHKLKSMIYFESSASYFYFFGCTCGNDIVGRIRTLPSQKNQIHDGWAQTSAIYFCLAGSNVNEPPIGIWIFWAVENTTADTNRRVTILWTWSRACSNILLIRTWRDVPWPCVRGQNIVIYLNNYNYCINTFLNWINFS